MLSVSSRSLLSTSEAETLSSFEGGNFIGIREDNELYDYRDHNYHVAGVDDNHNEVNDRTRYNDKMEATSLLKR